LHGNIIIGLKLFNRVKYAEFEFEAFFACTIPLTKLVFTQPGSINSVLIPN